jgi:hypothetical protein
MRPSARVAIMVALLVAGCALVASGFLIKHKVYDQADSGFDLAEFGLADLSPHRLVLEKDLLRDATFTGVIRKEGKLTTTYDRAASRGKATCPT